MLSIWPVIQPMSRVADFACCAILDFRSPCGNDSDNQGMPSGISAVAENATSDLTAKAGLNPRGQELFLLLQSGIRNQESYLSDYAGQTGSRYYAKPGMDKATGAGNGSNSATFGKGFGHTGSRPTGNR